MEHLNEEYQTVKSLYSLQVYQSLVFDLLDNQTVQLSQENDQLIIKLCVECQGITSLLGNITLTPTTMDNMGPLLDRYKSMQQEINQLVSRIEKIESEQKETIKLYQKQVSLEQYRYEHIFKKFKDILKAKKAKIKQLVKSNAEQLQES